MYTDVYTLMHTTKAATVAVRRGNGAVVGHAVVGDIDDSSLWYVHIGIAVDAVRVPAFFVDIALGLVLSTEVEVINSGIYRDGVSGRG